MTITQVMPEIRNAARAIIIRNSKILVLRKEQPDAATRFSLPGGGMHPDETLQQALLRECQEEIGTPVRVGPLLHVADYFKISTSVSNCRRHVVEFLFHCELPDSYEAKNGPSPDKHQIAVEWIDYADIKNCVMSPHYLSSCLPLNPHLPLYLGAFHEPDATQKR